MTSFRGFDIATPITNFGNLMAQGYKDQLALQQYYDEQKRKAEQQAFQNEILTREAENRYGARSFNEKQYPGLYEPMIQAISERFFAGEAPHYNAPQGMAPGAARPALLIPEEPIYTNAPGRTPTLQVSTDLGRSPAGARAQFDSTGDAPTLWDRIKTGVMSGLDAANPSGGGPRNQNVFQGTSSSLPLPPEVLAAPAPRVPPAPGDLPRGAELPGTGLELMRNRATDLMATSPQAPQLLERSKLETKRALADDFLRSIPKQEQKSLPKEAVEQVATQVVNGYQEIARNPSMSREDMARALGGYVDPYTGRAMVPKGAMEMLLRLEQREISAKNSQGFNLSDLIRFMALQQGQAELERKATADEMRAAIALSTRQNPGAQYQARGIEAEINAARDQIKALNQMLISHQAITMRRSQIEEILKQRGDLETKIKELSSKLGGVEAGGMSYPQALETVRGSKAQPKPQASPVETLGFKARQLPSGSFEITAPDGRKKTIPKNLYESLKSQGKL